MILITMVASLIFSICKAGLLYTK